MKLWGVTFEVRTGDLLYDKFLLTPRKITRHTDLVPAGIWNEISVDDNFEHSKSTTSYPVDGYLFSYFCNTLMLSESYRRFVLIHNYKQHLRKDYTKRQNVTVYIDLQKPEKEIIDYAWNSRVRYLLMQRKELETGMAWLSTLGGACSALGDCKIDFALVAGKISIEQFKIALQLGDPMVVVRCKLYFSLSLIQRGNLRLAKNIIIQQYRIVKSSAITDTRAACMCKGIWSRLRYEYKKRKMLKIKD